MMKLSYDLHIHSCLSPCGDDDMTPVNIINMAMLKELDVIALTDHNSCKNCPAFMSYASKMGILAIAGMELCTSEEVHVLLLFETLEDAMSFDEYVEKRIIPIANNEKIFGKQLIMDDLDEIIGRVDNLLILATTISFDEVYELAKKYNGVMIPAHIDKNSNSIISNLGFIPPNAKFTSLELINNRIEEKVALHSPYINQCKILHNSDAHNLGDIQEAEHFLEASNKTIESILRAL